MTVSIDDTGRRAVAHLPTHPDMPVDLRGADESALMTEVFERAHAEARSAGGTVTLEIADDRARGSDTAPVRFEVDPDQSMRALSTDPTTPGPRRQRRPSPVVRVHDDTTSAGRTTPGPASAAVTASAQNDSAAVVANSTRRPRPRSTPAFPPLAAPATSHPAVSAAGGPAQRGLRGRLNAALGLKLAAGEDEQGVRTAASVICGPVPDAAVVAVVNVKGGVGKTPITLGLASRIAAHRGRGTVAAVDLGEANNSFTDRISTPGAPGFDTVSLLDLYDDQGGTMTPAALSRYLIRQPSGEDVIIGRHHTGHIGTDIADSDESEVELGYDDARTLGELLARFRDVLVIDTGNSDSAGRWRWAVSAAQVVLVPVPLRADALSVARRMVHRIAMLRPAGLDGVFVVVTHGPGDTPAVEADQIEALIRQDGIKTVLRMPYEPVFASGEPIIADRLAPTTQDALTRLGSYVIGAMSTGVAMG